MDITVIGTGVVGTTLSTALSSAGHAIDNVGRAGLAASLDAAPEVVLLAVPGAAVLDVVGAHREQLDGALLVDASNHVGGERFHQVPEILEALPSVRLFRAFCSVGWEVMADPVVDGVTADLPFVGPNGGDRATVAGLISDVGFRPVWLGDNGNADVLDEWTRVWFALALGRGLGRHLALRVLTSHADV